MEFGTGALSGLKEAVNLWLLSLVVFLPVFRSAGACGAANDISKPILFFQLRPVPLGFKNNITNYNEIIMKIIRKIIIKILVKKIIKIIIKITIIMYISIGSVNFSRETECK